MYYTAIRRHCQERFCFIIVATTFIIQYCMLALSCIIVLQYSRSGYNLAIFDHVQLQLSGENFTVVQAYQEVFYHQKWSPFTECFDLIIFLILIEYLTQKIRILFSGCMHNTDRLPHTYTESADITPQSATYVHNLKKMLIIIYLNLMHGIISGFSSSETK